MQFLVLIFNLLSLNSFFVFGCISGQSKCDYTGQCCPNDYICGPNACCPESTPVTCTTNCCCPAGTACDYEDGDTYCQTTSSEGELLSRQKAIRGHSKLRHLQDETPSEGSINFINSYQEAVVQAYGFSYGLCLCTTSDCRKTVYNSTTETEYHFKNFVYAVDDTECSGQVTTYASLGFPKSNNFLEACSTTGKDFNVSQQTILGQLTGFSSTYGKGSLISKYYSTSDCSSNLWYEYQFQPAIYCGQSFDCYYGNVSIYPTSSDSLTQVEFTDSSCTTIKDELTIYLTDQCVDSNDDGINDTYTSTAYQGYNTDDDDNLSISKSDYGVLIAFVFISMLLGCALTAFYFIYWRKDHKKEGLSDQGL